MNYSQFRSIFVVLVFFGTLFGVVFPVTMVRQANAVQGEVLAVVSDTSKANVDQQLGNVPIYFEENRGQHNPRVKYVTRGGGTEMFLTATEAVYVVREQTDSAKDRKFEERTSTPDPKAVAVYMRLAGANANANFEPSQRLNHQTNYFKGTESNWRTNIANFGSVTAENIYDGVDIVWQGKNAGGVQYDFVLEPNADPSQIEWEIEGAKGVSLDADGSLVIQTDAGEMRQSKPFTYQESNGLRSEVASHFVLSEDKLASEAGTKRHRVRFALGEYDHSRTLTIDPTMDLAYSTFLGGPTRDEGRAIALDASGNYYVTGFSDSSVFPTTAGTIDTTHNDLLDVFVTKLNANGSGIAFSTFIGGNSDDLGYGIAIDLVGNIYLTGYTGGGSPTFPTTVGAYDTSFNGGFDVFVTKINASGSSLLYSTFVGGTLFDVGKGIVVDASGIVYITGLSDGGSPAFPTTVGAFDTTPNGDYDVFATKLNASGSSLIYSTFIGGNATDAAEGLALDASGNLFLTGYSNGGSTVYPTTAGAFDTSHNGAADVFITKLNSGGSSLLYSTFIGGNSDDLAFGLGIDPSGNAYITGRTTDGSSDYPTTVGAFDTTHNGFLDVFVTKLDAAGSSLVYSTYLGGVNDDFANGLTVDRAGNAIVTGRTDGFGYPIVAGSYDASQNGADDVFVTKLNAVGTALVSSTYIGGSADDVGFAVTSDPLGNIFVMGWSAGGSPAYPTTAGAADTTANGGNDVFVTKLFSGTAPFDLDGDRKTDLSIFRPNGASSEWWWLKSSTGGNAALQFGASTDVIVPADYTGDGKTDVAFWRPSTGQWFVLRSDDSSFFSFPLGSSGDVPAPADYDGDGSADSAVFRESTVTWYINRSTGGTEILGFGAAGDKPVNADYDGDGKADIAIFRPGGPSGAEWWVRRSSNGSVFALVFGTSTDKAVPGDYTGDGKADVAFWRPVSGAWAVLRSEDLSYFAFNFGVSGDIPSPGDYDGDGRFDAAVFRPTAATWYVNRTTAGVLIQPFGLTGDVPLPNAFVR